MSYTIRKLPNEPIVVFKAGADYDVQAEIQSVIRDANQILDSSRELLFQIIDFTDMVRMGMDDLMIGTDNSARGEASPFHHPKVRQSIFVTRNPALRMAAEGLGHDIYGNLFVPVFENYEDALRYVRSQLRS